MRSFLNFLTEKVASSARSVLTEREFLEQLKSKAANSHRIIKMHPIFTEASGGDFLLVGKTGRPESSPFWIDRLTNEQSQWKRYPKHGGSLRGYTDFQRYAHGEEVYVIIPLDGSVIGVCPKSSFYKSFGVVEKALGMTKLDNSGFTEWLQLLAKGINELGELEKKLDVTEAETYAEFKKQLKLIDKTFVEAKANIVKNLKKGEKKVDDNVHHCLTDLISRHVTHVERYLEEKLDPEENGFVATRIESFSKIDNEREIWTDQPCLLVKRSAYVRLHKSGDIK